MVVENLFSLDSVFFGNTLMQYLTFFASILGLLIVGKIILFVIQHQFKKFASKTDTKIDDLVLATIEKPIHLTFLVIGIFIGLSFLTLDDTVYPMVEKILTVLFYINLAWYVMRLSNAALDIYVVPFTEKSKSKLDDQLLPILRNTIKYSIVVLAGLIILDNVGFDVTTLIAGLGIGGLALAMASKDAVSNIFGGVTIFADKPFTIGDWVKFGNYSGTIEEVGIRSSRLRTFDGGLVTIPNSSFSTSPIENVSMRPTERVVTNLGLTYDTSVAKMKKAKEIIRDTISKTKGVDNKKFYISFTEFGDFALKVLMVYYIKDMSSYERRLEIKDEINMKIKERFEKAKIEMAFPTQTIYHHKF